jgi:regulator of CtrA degradation
MQLASWLLLHRAVNEGEMSLAQAQKEKIKVKFSVGDGGDPEVLRMLPQRLRNLIDRSIELQRRVRRLDALLHPSAPPAPRANPVEDQVNRLRAAFEQGGSSPRVGEGS